MSANHFGTSDRLPALQETLRRFVDEECIPRERPELGHDVQALDAVLADLRPMAQRLGLYTPQLPPAYGGLGLSWRDRCVILEEAGRSFLGAGALNCAPPDQPNMINLLTHGTAVQKGRYLEPLAAGRIRSCFAMTEPAPGAGSDPSMLATVARHRGKRWVIDGHKWFISGGVGCDFAIVLARTGRGATLFIVDADNPGMQVVRNIPSIDVYQIGGHAELKFTECAVGEEAVLGEVDEGFAYSQVRLEPARISHCMRYIGRASRALELAMDYARGRSSFGEPLAQLQQVQAMVADSYIDLHASRLMTWHCAAKLDAGESVRNESSMAKVFVSEAVNRVADRSAQMMGALGMSEDTVVSQILRELRPFRIYDGPSELHRATLGRRFFKETAGKAA